MAKPLSKYQKLQSVLSPKTGTLRSSNEDLSGRKKKNHNPIKFLQRGFWRLMPIEKLYLCNLNDDLVAS